MIQINSRAKMSFAGLIPLPADKDADSLGQSGHDTRNDLFDQYLIFDTANVDGSIFLAAPESTVLATPVKGTISLNMAENGTRQCTAYQSPCEPQHHQSPPIAQDASKGNLYSTEDPGRRSDTEFGSLSLETISLNSSPITWPSSSPQLLVAKTSRGRLCYLERTCKPLNKETNYKTLRKSSPVRKATPPAKMMYRPQYSQQTIHDLGHRLALDATKFDFGFQHNSHPLSPPPSTRVSDSPDHPNSMNAATDQNNDGFTWDHQSSQQLAYGSTGYIDSPLTTPPADTATFHQSNHHVSSNNLVYTISPRNQSLTSSAQTPVSSEYNFEPSTAYLTEADSAPIWWGDAADAPLVEPIPAAYHRLSKYSTRSLAMHLQAELGYNANELELNAANLPSGLMIQLPSTFGSKSFGISPSPISPDESGDRQEFLGARAAALHNFQPQHRHTQSPLPRNYAQLDRKEKARSHSRIESSSPSPRTRASSYHVLKKRSFSRKHSTEQSGGAQRTSKLGSWNSTGMVADFVNFTPDDSMKILTGVAPSGSSKTKARREKEAAEKTRRLSQAAVRAVQAVGGSIESLVEEGFIPPSELEIKEVEK